MIFTMNRRVVIAALALIILSGTPFLKTAAQSKRLCPKCKSTGKIANPFYTEAIERLEKNVRFCSYCFEKDTEGHGLPWLPCKRCRNPDLAAIAKVEFDRRVAERAEWLEKRRSEIDFLNPREKPLILETEHFIIFWNIPKIVTREKKIYKKHEALHLYADRMEAFYADFQKTLDIEEKEMRNKKHYLYLFDTQKSCLKASKELTGLNCWNAAKLPGNPSILISWKDRDALKTDDDFHRHLVHHVSHLLNVAYYRMEWLAMEAGWADAGLAHYFEIKYFDQANNTCDEEGEEEEFTNSDWEVDVRKELAAGELQSFADLSLKSTTALHGDDHKLAWSYVDFLLKKDSGKFKLFMKGIKEKKPCRDALKAAYGLSFIGLQTGWEAYVLENYREKPRKTGPAARRNRR